MLGRSVTCEEIYEIVCSMNAFKAPASDGFQAILYQSHWKIVGDSFVSRIQEVFQ